MLKFSTQFLENYCKKFINDFKRNSESMISKYDTNTNITINHINFIVIGKAGVGKSTLINSILQLKGSDEAKEGIGESITSETKIYESKKIKMIRMYDTRGLDDKILKETIFDEVKLIVEKSRKLGPDNYINCILYCTEGKRFQEEDGLLIEKIMELYPLDNLPVIITQLQYYAPEDAENMKKEIIRILQKYLRKDIVEKIQIKDVFSKEKKTKNFTIPSRGIPDLLKTSIDLMSKAIHSATHMSISEEITSFCTKNINEKLNFIENKFNVQFHVLYDCFLNEKRENELSNNELYVEIENGNNIIKEKKENKYCIEPKNRCSNYLKNNFEKQNFKEEFMSILLKNIISVYCKLNGIEDNLNKLKNEPIYSYIEKTMEHIKQNILKYSKESFNEWLYTINRDYYYQLEKIQSKENQKYGTNKNIINHEEVASHLNNKLTLIYENEILKYSLCIISQMFCENLKKNIYDLSSKHFKNNEKINELLSQKAKMSLKNVTKKLKENLEKEIKIFFPENDNNNNNIKNNYNNISKYKMDNNQCSRRIEMSDDFLNEFDEEK